MMAISAPLGATVLMVLVLSRAIMAITQTIAFRSSYTPIDPHTLIMIIHNTMILALVMHNRCTSWRRAVITGIACSALGSEGTGTGYK
jgi:hypothetical protein